MCRSLKHVVVLCSGLLAAGMFTCARADVWNKKTVVTFPEAVEIPGAVLEPGRYVMKLVDSQSDRHIVQFLNADENRVYSTALAIPNSRFDPADKTILTFYEVPGGKPQALRAWFYPGDTIGQEFAYPKARATQIARATALTVPALPSNSEAGSEPSEAAITPAVTESSVDATTPAPTDEESATSLNESASPAESPAPTPEASQAPAAETQQPEVEKEKMPQTAGTLPLLALLGVCSLGLAATLRIRAKRLPIS